MGRSLLKGGCVLSLDRKVGNFRVADVLIEEGRIAEVGPDLRARGAEVVDAADTIVMPGFVDAHRHAWQSLSRGGGDGETASGSAFSSDDVYAATLIGLLGAMEAGITGLVDWFDMPGGSHADAAFQAHADSGLRTVFVTSARPEAAAAPKSSLTTIAAGGDDPGAWATAREQGLRIHAHAALSAEMRGLGVMAPMLGNDVTLVHGSYLEDRDLDAVASSGAAIVLAPSSEMAGGLPPLDVQKLIDRGIRPGLAVDTERIGPGDLFAQMRAAISLQHARLFDLKLAGKAGLPKLLTTREVIRYATIDGARAIGLGEATGSLTPGKQADVVVLRTDRPNIYPINDPIGAVVWGMDTSNVDWVFVGGRPMMQSGSLVADVTRARNLANDARERMTRASATLSPAGEAS
ncbi:MAG TPA: amidohydrolase family protein [Acidimicrobiia bacterium]|nr:amidohydrolase family protein [Acidimicrobiia bacterium]